MNPAAAAEQVGTVRDAVDALNVQLRRLAEAGVVVRMMLVPADGVALVVLPECPCGRRTDRHECHMRIGPREN